MENEEKLQERIKELECLYAISTQLSQSSDLATVAPKICKHLEKGFRFPEYAFASITLQNFTYGEPKTHSKTALIKQNIISQQELIGHIMVSYLGGNLATNSFLIEEKKLLNKVAQEIALLYERQQHKVKEDLLNAIVRRQERLSILGEMTAGITHELNTPLGNMIGFSEFIINSTNEETTRADARKIRQSALHAREIVKKLMYFSCDIPQKLDSFNVDSIISEAIQLLTPLLKQKQINIEFEPTSKNLFAVIDKIQFTQVIFNLLSNSIQASQPQDKIIINTTENMGFISISVQDFGCGIPIQIQDKIFEPFFTNKEIGTGNGLGLSVVHGIIKKHKGRIQFSSEENVGTTFVVSIPQQL